MKDIKDQTNQDERQKKFLFYAVDLGVAFDPTMSHPAALPYLNVYPHEQQNLRSVSAAFNWQYADSVALERMSHRAGIWSCRQGQ